MSVVELTAVSKKYGSGDVDALNDISFSVEMGEIYALLGPNGAGKTTTIEILTGQTKPDSGDISVLGINPSDSPIDVREQVGILPEREKPPSFLTPREYFQLVGDMRDIESTELNSLIETWADWLSFSDKLDTLHTNLSRGQQQKVMITQAFVHQPDLVIIDEPLVNLDPIMQKKVKDLFVEYVDDNRTILLSTHDITVAEDICTTVGFVKDGNFLSEYIISNHNGEQYDLLSVFEMIVGEDSKLSMQMEGA